MDKMLKLECHLVAITSLLDALTLVDQVEPKGENRQRWHRAILGLHGELQQTAGEAAELFQTIYHENLNARVRVLQ